MGVRTPNDRLERTLQVSIGEGASVMLDSLAFRLGVSRSAFITAAIEQAIARYLHGISDPLRPIPSYTPRTSWRIVTDDGDWVKRLEAAEPLTSPRFIEHVVLQLRKVRPIPAPEYKPNDRFDPDDPTTYRARKTE